MKSGIIVHNIADHFPVVQCSALGDPILQKQHASRYFTRNSLEKFHFTLKKVDLSPVLQELDLDKSYATFNELLHNQFEIFVPLLAELLASQKRQTTQKIYGYWLYRD